MRIWIVNPFDPIPGEGFRPGRYAFICEQLARAGHEVTWWSSNFFHALKEKRGEGRGERRPRQNVRIILLPTPPYKRNVSFMRLYNHYVFARQFMNASLGEEAPELVMASFPPIGSSRKASRYAAGVGARLVLDVQDLWPDAFAIVAPTWLRSATQRCLLPLRIEARDAFTRADGIIGVSRTYVDWALAHARSPVPSLVLPIGVDVEAFRDDGDGGWEDRTGREPAAVFVGTIGRSYDLWTLVEVAARLAAEGSHLIFRIVGDGPEMARLRRTVERMRLANVVLHGLLPLNEVAALLRRSMVGLHTLARGATGTLTNKLFEYLAAGLPVLNSSPGEAAELLETEGVGVTYAAGDSESLRRGLEALIDDPGCWSEMSARARRLAVERFDRRKIYERLHPFLEQVCAT